MLACQLILAPPFPLQYLRRGTRVPPRRYCSTSSEVLDMQRSIKNFSKYHCRKTHCYFTSGKKMQSVSSNNTFLAQLYDIAIDFYKYHTKETERYVSQRSVHYYNYLLTQKNHFWFLQTTFWAEIKPFFPQWLSRRKETESITLDSGSKCLGISIRKVVVACPSIPAFPGI